MYLLGATRHDLLEFLPGGGTVAEIGVAEGEFSEAIIAVAKPARLHLIDPWRHQDREDYRRDAENVAQPTHDERYARILAGHAEAIGDGRVVVHRAFSGDAVSDFADGYFDWVFIDGLHTFDGCLSDLSGYAPKVKDDGFIVGHDYANHPKAEHDDFGVVAAVNQFLAETGYAFVALTNEEYPTYVIAKEPDSERCRTFVAEMLHRLAVMAEIVDAENKAYRQIVALFSDGTKKTIFSFE